MNISTGYWQTVTCAGSHYSACQSRQPYEWSISSQHQDYQKAGLTCPKGTEFGVPRTALQNTYLYHAFQDFYNSHPSYDSYDGLLWVDFNDLDDVGCWVIGQNATCPYLPSKNNDREIIVPTVAAVLVFVVAALTVFIKCAANRQRTKRARRRGSDGWDYEGVPS